MFTNIKVGARLAALSILPMLMLGLVMVAMLLAMNRATEGMRDIYEEKFSPATVIMRVQYLMADNRAQVALGVQHDPAGRFAKDHDHPGALHTDNIGRNRDEINEILKRMDGHASTPQERTLLDAYKESRGRFVQEGLAPAAQALSEGDYNRANQLLLTKMNPLMAAAQKDAEALRQYYLESTAADYKDASERSATARLLAILVAVAAVVVSLFFAGAINRSIVPRLQAAVALAGAIAAGRLNNTVPATGNDEIGALMTALARMQDSLRQMVAEMQRGAGEVAGAAAQLSAAAAQISASSGQQSESAAAMAAAIEEMTVSIAHVSGSAAEASRITNEAGTLSGAGDAIIQEAVDGMRKIADTVAAASVNIRSMDENAQRISGIVQVIRGVADQTNLLALNAAIEAARAGEQGRGFAVVADEVRKLAEKSAQATTEIAEMIAGVQQASHEAAATMDQAVDHAGAGVQQAQRAGQTMRGIHDGARQASDAVQEISNALREQSMASNDVAKNVERIAQMTEENNAATREAADAACRLGRLAEESRTTAGRFQV